MGHDFHRRDKELALELALLRLRIEDCWEASELLQHALTLAEETNKPAKARSETRWLAA